MFIMLLKGIAIGLIFGVPAGAVGAMTVQRTSRRATKPGWSQDLAPLPQTAFTPVSVPSV